LPFCKLWAGENVSKKSSIYKYLLQTRYCSSTKGKERNKKMFSKIALSSFV
jgi:hypothetical protein